MYGYGFVGAMLAYTWLCSSAIYDCVELRRAKYWTMSNVKPLYDAYTTYLTAAVRKRPRKGRPESAAEILPRPQVFFIFQYGNEKRRPWGRGYQKSSLLSGWLLILLYGVAYTIARL